MLLKNEKLKFRHAATEDCSFIWEWRNHVLIRRFSTLPDFINFKEHKEWFILEKNYLFFLIGEINNKPVSVLHNKIDGDNIHVSIYLRPSLIGRKTGIATLTLKYFYEEIKTKYPSAIKLIATIHRNNIASRKLFIKAGYANSEFITMEKIIDVNIS